MGLYATTQEDCIELGDGCKAYLKQDMTAGDQEDLEDYCYLARQTTPDDAPATREQAHLGNLRLAFLVTTRLVDEAGKEHKPTWEQFRQLDRVKASRLIFEAALRCPPLGVSRRRRKTTGKSTTPSGA